jgi:hypothetical protein
MSDRRYYLDYYAALPTELDEDERDMYEDEDFENDMYHLNHERAVRVAIDNIRDSLRFLAECTDVTYSMEESVIYFSDGGNIVHLIREHDQ